MTTSFKIDRAVLSRSGLAAFADDDNEDSMQQDLEAAHEESQRLKVEGGLRAEQGDWGTALSLWNKALALTPEDGILHEMRSQALNEVEDAWGAVQAASRAAELLPRSADVLVTLARAQLNLGEPIMGLSSIEKALQLQPDHVEALTQVEEAKEMAQAQQRLGPGARLEVRKARRPEG